MAENERENIEINKDTHIHDPFVEDDDEMQQNKYKNETEFEHKTSYNPGIVEMEVQSENANKKAMILMAKNSIQMRLKILSMSVKVIKIFLHKNLLENNNITYDKIQRIESNLEVFLATNNLVHAEKNLIIAEDFSTELMKRIKQVINKESAKNEEKQNEDDMEVPDYRSIVTVRGTKEDVINCILRAETALGTGKYDRAESLLLKAERILPTKNARELLRQVRAAKDTIQNPERIENATKVVQQDSTVNQEVSKLETLIINVDKCLKAYENAFSIHNFEKAQRMLYKAKRFDPSLDVEEKLSLVKTAIANQINEEKRKDIEKAITECKNPDECLYRSMIAYVAGDLHNAELFLIQATRIDPMLNLESELLNIRREIAAESIVESKIFKNTSKTGCDHPLDETKKLAAEYLFKGKKAYDDGSFKIAEKNLQLAKCFDSRLNLDFYLSNCTAQIASRSSTETVHSEEPSNIVSSKHYMSLVDISKKTEDVPLLADEKVKKFQYFDQNQAKPSHEITNSETEFSCLEDDQQNDRREGKCEHYENKKDNNKHSKTNTDKYELGKDGKKQTSNELKSKNIDKSIQSQFSNKSNTDIKTRHVSPKREQANNLISMAEKEINNISNKTEDVPLLADEKVKNFQYFDQNQAKPSHEITNSETEFSCLEDDQQNDRREGKLNTSEHYEKKKDNYKHSKTNTDKYEFGKDGKKQTSNELKSKNIDKSVQSQFSNKSNTDIKTRNVSPKREQAKNLISMAEKKINKKKIENAMNFLNNAEEIYPTTRAKELLDKFNKIRHPREETNVHLNCYEFPVEINEDKRQEALKCIEIAQSAYATRAYDKAEHFLLKSLRICDSERAKSYLEKVRTAKVKKQINSNIPVKTEDDNCLNAVAGHLHSAEYLSKSSRIYTNNEVTKQTKNVHDDRAAAIKYNEDSKLEEEAEMFVNLALDAIRDKKHQVARIYLQSAYNIRPNDKVKELLADENKKINKLKDSQCSSKTDFIFETNKLLDKAENCIRIGDLDKAESFLTVSWDMNLTKRTTLMYKKLVESRIASKDNNSFSKQFVSHKLVLLALDEYHNTKFEEAKKSLMEALSLYPSVLIKNFLNVLEPDENPSVKTKICQFVKKIFH